MEITEPPVLEVSLSTKGEGSIIIESDHQIEEIVKALASSTSLDMTEANISAQIKKLEKAGLIDCNYSSGQHGVRKISSLKYNKLIIKF